MAANHIKKATWTTGVVGGVMVLALGCSADPTPQQEETTDQAESGLLLCPLTNRLYYQQRATDTVKYIFGGDNPFPNTTACSAAKANVDLLIGHLDSGACVLGPAAGTSRVCGLDAVLYKVNCSLLTGTSWVAMLDIAANLDGCWGSGVSSFFFTGVGLDLSVYMDPEPAQLTQDLMGSSGATAAALYLNSQTETTSFKWPGTYTSGGAYPPLAGAPCSTTDLVTGTETQKMIFASGSYRKCL
jgi:hypothetical protein